MHTISALLNTNQHLLPEGTSSYYSHVPASIDEPYNYNFKEGDAAWAPLRQTRQEKTLWHRVIIASSGHYQSPTKGPCRTPYRHWFVKYPATETSPLNNPTSLSREVYSAMVGELKPDTPQVRKLLYFSDALSQIDQRLVALEVLHECGFEDDSD